MAAPSLPSSRAADWLRAATARPRAASIVVLLVLLTATAAATSVTRQILDERREATLERRTTRTVEAIDRRIAAYTEILYGARSHAAGRRPDPDDFHRYIAGLDVPRRRPGVQVIVFAAAVPGHRLETFGRRLAADVRRSPLPYPPYRLTPPGRRADHVIISATEPQRGNERAFGFDLLAEPTRRAAVERARDTGAAAATGRITLVQETGTQHAFLMMLPAYAPDLPTRTVAERRRAFVGVHAAAFRMGDLMAGVGGGGARTGRLAIYDGGAVGVESGLDLHPDRLLSASDPSAPETFEGAHRTAVLEVAGRRWLVDYRDAGSGLASTALWAVAAAGAAISLLASWLVLSLTGSRAHALRLAEDMTSELRRRELALEERARDLERSNRDLERSNRDLAQFASVASHDLKTPLRTVKGYVDLLSRRYGGRLDRDADEYLAFASEGTVRMQALIDDLLAYAAVGSHPRRADDVDLSDVVRRSVATLHRQIATTGAEVVVDELPWVRGDERQLAQLVGNLLSNALKFADPARRPVITVGAERLPDAWRIDVTDNGIGVADEDAERIFAMFGRLHSADAYPGTGIGLAICQRIAENHGGEVGVRPNDGAGATFSFTLPRDGTPGRAGAEPVTAASAA